MAEDEAGGSSLDDFKKACLVRNQNEKKRRDRFNNLVNELSASLPMRGKKLSRNNVLKYCIEYFRHTQQLATTSSSNSLERVCGSWQPDFITSEEFRQTMLDGLDGIVIAIDDSSKICFASSSVFPCLGYDCKTLQNSSILDLVHPEDQRTIYALLTAFDKDNTISRPAQMFSCRLRFAPRSAEFRGGFVPFSCIGRTFRTDQTRGDRFIVFLGRVTTLPKLNKTVVLADNEHVLKFTTRLDKMWRFQCVERGTTMVLGYYPFELLGQCLYEYCHEDDLANLTEYHNMLLYSGVITTCCYRLLAKGQVWIWVRSRCHVSYSPLDSKPDSVICVTWPMKGTEFSALNQREILERDRQLFSQILEKSGEKLLSSNFCSGTQKNAVTASSPPSSSPSLNPILNKNEILEQSHAVTACEELPLGLSTMQSSFSITSDHGMNLAAPQNVDASIWPVGGVDSAAVVISNDNHFNSSDPLVYSMENVDEKSLLLADHDQMPESLSFSQWVLHLHLRDQYKSLTDSIRQQSEQIAVIQRQLAIQKELSTLSDELEVQQKRKTLNLKNTVDEIKSVIQQKMKELQECTQLSSI